MDSIPLVTSLVHVNRQNRQRMLRESVAEASPATGLNGFGCRPDHLVIAEGVRGFQIGVVQFPNVNRSADRSGSVADSRGDVLLFIAVQHVQISVSGLRIVGG